MHREDHIAVMHTESTQREGAFARSRLRVMLRVIAVSSLASGCVGGGSKPSGQPASGVAATAGSSDGSSGSGGSNASASGKGTGGAGTGAGEPPPKSTTVQSDATDAGGSASSPPTMLAAGAKDSHYPLADGATWAYHHTKPTKADWDENDSMRATMYMGKPAFILEDQEDEQGVQTHSTLVVKGSGVYRVYQEESVSSQVALTVTYDPPFLRYDEAWMDKDQTVTLTDDWTRTCILGNTAASGCTTGTVKPGMTTHTYTVIDPAAKVSVPAGSFDAVEIQHISTPTRVRPSSTGSRQVWERIRDETPMTMAVTELTSYSIP